MQCHKTSCKIQHSKLLYREVLNCENFETFFHAPNVRCTVFKLLPFCMIEGRHGGLMVSALDSGTSSLGLSPCRGHCVVFLGKTLLSRCLSPPRCTGEFNAGGNPTMDQHPIQGGVEILVVASCYHSQSTNYDATETGISSGLMDHLARMQTLPLPTHVGLHSNANEKKITVKRAIKY